MLRNRCVLLVMVIFCGLLAACASNRADPKAIVGKWVNSHGYTIEYDADGSGHIPAADGIAASDFTYAFRDAGHLAMNVAGQTMVVQVQIDGDKLTWLDQATGTSFEYTRVK